VSQTIQTDAVSLKRWFRTHMGIPVRVQTLSGKNPWVRVWIQSRKRPVGGSLADHPLAYDHVFPMEFGEMCVRATYPNSPTLHAWCGNINAHDISMHAPEFVSVLEKWESRSPVEAT